jgi:hypothetical protein
MSWNLGPQSLDWVSPSRIFATTIDLFNAQPNYEHEVAIALDSRVKYQGIAPVIGGWNFADGTPGPYPPTPDPPPVNDSFTKLMLRFEGIEGSNTYVDTNAAGIPRKWSQRSGFGRITNIGEIWDEGALYLDGKTVITAPDAVDFIFEGGNFAIRGWFLCDFPLGETRVLAAKTDQNPLGLGIMFALTRTSDGFFHATSGADQFFDHRILDRFEQTIVARNGQVVVSNFAFVPGGDNRDLQSTTMFSDTINTGWHAFDYFRNGSFVHLVIDNVVEASLGIDETQFMSVFGPITIGGYGPPINGMYSGLPWKGGLDRFAVDIGIAR